MLEISPDNTVAGLTHIYTEASTFPCRVTTQVGSEWVMKFVGAGPGPVGLLTEYVALRVARAMGLAVPSVQPLHLPHDFPWTIGTDEFDGIVQRSFGWNLGTNFIDGAIPATAEQVRGAESPFQERLVQVDRFLANTDRSARNTNVLALPGGGLVAIDFDASLFLRRAARGVLPKAFPLSPDHLLLDRSDQLPPHPPTTASLIAAIDEAPGEWIEPLDVDRDALKSGLIDYANAWSRSA